MINRISQLAPEKDLKKYYIRDALGNFARFTNDKMINMLSIEYSFDIGTKHIVNEYHLEENDGWTFLNIYLGRIYGKNNDIISEGTKNVIEKIIIYAPVCLSVNNTTEKQEKINELQNIIRKYTKQNKINIFCDDIESLLYSYEHSSFIAYSMLVTIICMILNEYDPYDICYINGQNKAIYYYCELSRKILKCCDFREVSLEQSANLLNHMDYIKSNLNTQKIKEFGSPESFNIAYSKKMLKEIMQIYGSKCFNLAAYVLQSNSDSTTKTAQRLKTMSENANDVIISASARYFDNTIKLLQFSSIDISNQLLIEDINNNRMKLFLNFDSDELVNNMFFELLYRYYTARFLQNNFIDIIKRKRLFVNGIDIEFNPSNELFKNVGFKYHIQEYVYKGKLRIYIRIQNRFMNRYFIVSEGHKDWSLLCYNGYEFIALLFAFVLIGIENISDTITDICKEFFLAITHKNDVPIHEVYVVDANGVKTNDSDMLVTQGCLFMSKAIMECVTEIEVLFNNQINGSGNMCHGRKILGISESYSEEINLSPFVRKLPVGQHASDRAKKIAKQIKVDLPDGYTIVEAHSREIKKRIK